MDHTFDLARSRSAALRAHTATRAPRLANSRASTRPRPRDPPVINTDLSRTLYRREPRSNAFAMSAAPSAVPAIARPVAAAPVATPKRTMSELRCDILFMTGLGAYDDL